MRMMRTSTNVSAQPATKGIFRSKLSAIADPMTFQDVSGSQTTECCDKLTSAMSVAMMAASPMI